MFILFFLGGGRPIAVAIHPCGYDWIANLAGSVWLRAAGMTICVDAITVIAPPVPWPWPVMAGLALSLGCFFKICPPTFMDVYFPSLCDRASSPEPHVRRARHQKRMLQIQVAR